jgi:hypothetical protein
MNKLLNKTDLLNLVEGKTQDEIVYSLYRKKVKN